jgi:two-component system alkaline phosphatase synthesis response regulator PhoP
MQNETRPGDRPVKIVVADDEQAILRMLTHNLTRRGYEVVTAADGEEALNQIEDTRPDLVILDLMMPRKSAARCASGARYRLLFYRREARKAARSKRSTWARMTT